MINIQWSLCCYNVSTTSGGLGNLKGVFEGLYNSTIPYRCPNFYVALGTRVSVGDDDLQIVFSHREADGGRIIFSTDPAANHISVQGKYQGTAFKILSIAINGLVLPEFGAYRYQVFINGSNVHVSSFDFLSKRPG